MTDTEIELLTRGSSFHISNQFQQAHDCYVQAIQINVNSHHAHHLIGLLFLQNGFIEQGHRHFDLCFKLKPDYLEAKRNLSIFIQSSDSKVLAEYEVVEKHDTYQKFPESSVGGWRHLRMLDFASCFASASDTWLTLGDAYGHDAYMLKKLGIQDVLASNLESSNLEAGFQCQQVDKYITVNAEHIQLDSNSIDYVLCKEALHHMPRPTMAIYEMLRVARKGVFFIEPQDQVIDWPLGRHENFYRDLVPSDSVGERISIKNAHTQQEVSSSYMDWWEDQAFNYVYTFSKREIRKIALGMGIPSFAMKNFNDFYNPEWNNQAGTPGVEGFDRTLEQIQMHDTLCQVTGKAYSYITGLLFKETPSPHIVNQLSHLGYQFTFTPTRYLPIQWPTF